MQQPRREPAPRPDDAGVPHDGRDPVPGVHPAVKRSGRSQATVIGFVAALLGALALYLLILAGITLPGI